MMYIRKFKNWDHLDPIKEKIIKRDKRLDELLDWEETILPNPDSSEDQELDKLKNEKIL